MGASVDLHCNNLVIKHGPENVIYFKFFRSKDQVTITILYRAVQTFWAWPPILWHRSKWIWNTRLFCKIVYIKQLPFEDSHSSAVLLFYEKNQVFYIRISTISSKSMANIYTVLNSDMLTISHITKWIDGAELSLGSHESFSWSWNFLPLTESTGLLLYPQCPKKPVSLPCSQSYQSRSCPKTLFL